MDEQSSNVSNNSQPSNDHTLESREFALKEREIALRELEIQHKSKLEQKNIWFTSPLLIGITSAVFGLMGTAFGAAFQGFSNFQLERQKFEFELIRKALETEDKLIENHTDRTEAAKKLRFLVDSGIIQSLDSDSIRKLADNPDDLPNFSSSISRAPGQFSCQLLNNIPTTVASHPRRGSVSFIQWKSNYFGTPLERCLEASNNFQVAQSTGILKYLTIHHTKDGNAVLCASKEPEGSCDFELFKLKPSEDSNLVLEHLHDLNIGVSDKPLIE